MILYIPQAARSESYRACVLFLYGGVERKSPWFTNRARAMKAKAIIQKRYGQCVLYFD